MKYQIITIGSALVDIFVHSDNFKTKQSEEGLLLCQLYGDKIELDSFKVYSGGGAGNTAVGFARLGLRVAAICETGRDDLAKIVLADLNQDQVSTDLVIHEKKEQTGGSVILVGEKGGRTIMTHRGASSQLDTFDISPYWLSQTNWVHLTSIAGRQETLKKIFLIVKKEQLDLSWNPGKAELHLLANREIAVNDIPCRLFFVNAQEWQLLEPVQDEILKHFFQVIVTNGDQGGDVYQKGKHSLHFQSLKIKSVDDTGAGDAFATGYVAAQILGYLPTISVAWGVQNASSVIQHYGAKPGLLTRAEIEKIMRKSQKETLQSEI